MHDEDLPLQLARTKRFTHGVPRAFTVAPDGARVLFLRSAGGRDPVARLWSHQGGGERLLVDPGALGARGGVAAYATDDAVRTVALAVDGALWLASADGGPVRRLPAAGPVGDPRPSPDGRHVAYVSRGALHVVGADGRGGRPLAVPEGPEVEYATADHVSAGSIGRARSYWWAPDGSALLVVRVDHSPVGRLHLGDPADPGARPGVLRFPAAGTANARVELHVVRLDGTRVRVELPGEAEAHGHPGGAWTDRALEYLVAAGWDASGPYALTQTRDQRTAYLLGADPASGRVEVLDRRHDDAWLEFVPGTPLRTRERGWVVTVREGRRGLLMTGTGRRTPEELYVDELLGADGERLYFTAVEDSGDTHVWCHEPRGGFTRLTGEPGTHTAVVGGGAMVLERRTVSDHTVEVLRDGEPAGTVAVLAEDPLVAPRPEFLTLGERGLRAALYLPSGHEPGSGRLPVVVHSYGGPGVRTAVRTRAWWHAVNQWYAEQGFAVLTVDGRGTPGRDRDWEVAVHGDQSTPVLDDQADALRAAARHCPDLNTGRVGVRGWSFGGFLAAAAVLHRPEVFHAAVAGAATAEPALYDTYWKERYLGHPGVCPEAYERCSLVAHAHRLTRPLMLVHGMADTNVVPAHMLRFSAALLAAGRPHTVLPLAGQTHLVTAEGVADTLLRADLEFLRRALATETTEVPEVPETTETTEGMEGMEGTYASETTGR
ncbi:prolyl oligopeptidase family serine peptidase [Streptomyces sp. NPDC001941]|uniref:prolyl oligopeptidase family serine peptidase n=1 Tax=Streptomyces sp. NPDC001941 TaxID=3154659 RepID=UPI0033263A19